jgi:uncharacterized protein YuzE
MKPIILIGIEFDYHDFVERGDTLYLHVGAPSEPARAIETPEGHVGEYDDHGAVIGLELLNVTSILERDGKLRLSWPETELDAATLNPALVAAA